jgi:hemolysin D
MTQLSKYFPNLTRHAALFRDSWRARSELDAMARPTSDREFLPAALEIIETPPSPVGRLLALGLCGLLVILLIWSFVGKIDIVATATGKVVPQGNVKIIQSVEVAVVRRIHVRNGQRVKAGDLLVEFDPTLASAALEANRVSRDNARQIAARNRAVIGYIDDQSAASAAGTNAVQRRYAQATISEFEAQTATLRGQQAERTADLAAVDAEIAKLEQTLPLLRNQLEARQDLAERGYYSKLRLLEYEQLLVAHLRDIDVARANRARARAAVKTLDAQIGALRATLGRTAAGELAEAEGQAAIRDQDVRGSLRRQDYVMLRAPVAGTVQQLAVATVGGVVEAAQPLMVIVPDDPAVVVEAMVENRDIAFIRKNQPVRVKFEALPFTDFGVGQGRVDTISRDAVDTSGAQGKDGIAVRNNGRLVYPVRIMLDRNWIAANGQRFPIGPGMAVQAEIKIGRRRIIDYVLSPLVQTFDEAARER